jgi:dihydroorotase
MTINTLEFAADDLHVHLRDNNDGRLQMAAPMTAKQFSRALVMPNLIPGITTVAQAMAYRDRILQVTGDCFEPLMTLYLTEAASAQDIADIKANPGVVHSIKYYPAGATTNSDQGVLSLRNVMSFLELMQENDLVLSLHGESRDPSADIFDLEKYFIDEDWWHIRRSFPALRMVFEHITTAEAVQAVRESPYFGERIVTAATATPQHMMINRNAILRGGNRPHNYCLPIAKREQHRMAVLEAAVSGDPRFFLGTDSAPHAKHTKENACGCAGCFTGLHALELYAEAFDGAGKVEMLPAFAGKFGADFYGLPYSQRLVRLNREEWSIPKEIPYGESSSIVPFYAGETLHWKMVN